MLDVVLTYFFFILAYPIIVGAAALAAPLQLFSWLCAGVATLVVAIRFAGAGLSKLWVALWFLPATIICGASTLTPWPFALFNVVRVHNGCSTAVSLAVCLLLNVGIVFGASAMFVRWRRRRAVAA